jgi:hypothetical protein
MLLENTQFILLVYRSDQGDKWIGSISAIKARAPITGGAFGVWGGKLIVTFSPRIYIMHDEVG